MILALDPGKDKCGLALFGKDGKVVEQRIVKRRELHRAIAHYHEAARIVIGDSANGRAIAEELKKLNLPRTISLFPEKDTTWQARKLYWRAHPPQGWRRFVPVSLLTVPVPVDDYAAVIIGQRYLATK
ncbi:MAG: pre-16S rRNA-processing nuclease YqgF [Candidatus Saganbacteria bacterium]|nr:pre-16S rRNA-processing nuclease YqgF [Candidatus Saganbacteria bacterium]